MASAQISGCCLAGAFVSSSRMVRLISDTIPERNQGSSL